MRLPTLILLLSLQLAATLPAQFAPIDEVKPIEPPFGLEWGETPKNVENWAQRNQFGTAQGKTKDGRHAIEIQGPFPDAEFQRLRFYFKAEKLTEVEIQFYQTGDPADTETEFNTFTQALGIKDRIDGQFGKGQLIKNEKGSDKDSEWQFIQQVWTDEEHAIWLAVFSAKKPGKGILTVTSLHYRWETEIKGQTQKSENSP